MEIPLLHRQLQDQLRQSVQPKDQRHLQGFAEILVAILQVCFIVNFFWSYYYGF